MELQQYHNGLYIPPLLGDLDEATIETIVALANVKWNKRLTAEGGVSGSINIVYNSIKLAGKYHIQPQNSTYQVYFECQHQGKTITEGVYHNESMVACMELCREDLLTRIAKIHKNIPHLRVTSEASNVSAAQRSYRQQVKKNCDGLSFL